MKSFCICTKNLNKTTDRVLIDHLNFTAYSGEIHAIIGNNGEGKTVFAKLLSGVLECTSGSIFLKGKELHITDVPSAQQYGIYMLQQEHVLFPELNVRNNLIAGNEHFVKNSFWSPSRRTLDKVCQEQLSKFGLENLDLNMSIQKASAYEKLIIQLCRILICKPKVLILDEPATCLTPRELKKLFEFLEEYKKDTIIIVITHSYSLLLQYCNRLSIIDGGTVVAAFDEEEFTHPRFKWYIDKLKLNFTYPTLHLEPAEELVHIEQLSFRSIHELTFSLHEKEIVGLTGLTNDEKDFLYQLLFGKLTPESGFVRFFEFSKRPYINLISDREADKTLFLTQSIPFNIAASDFRKTRKTFFVSKRTMNMYGFHYLKKLDVKDADITSKPYHLSTGTKQKVVIGRSLFNQSKIYIYDEPTKNLDSSSKLDLYNILNALALEGATILLISSDYEELLAMCSRIILVKEGQQMGNYSTNYLSVEALSKELE